MSESPDGLELSEIHVPASRDWAETSAEVTFPKGKGDLYLRYRGKGSKSLLSIRFETPESNE